MLHARHGREDLRHADGQRDGAAGPAGQVLAHGGTEGRQVDGGKTEFLENSGGHIDGEIIPGDKGRRGDKRHDGNEAFGQHRPVADQPYIFFARYHFRRSTGAYQAVEAGDSAAGDSDADIRPDAARDYRAAAVDEAAVGRCGQGRVHPEYADSQRAYGPYLHIGA